MKSRQLSFDDLPSPEAPMNICPTCYNGIPQLAMACPVCQRAKFFRALEDTEIKVIAQVVAGNLSIRLLRVGRGPHHIAYHDGFSHEPYCQVKLRSPRPSQFEFANWPPKSLCPNCLSTFKEFVERSSGSRVK